MDASTRYQKETNPRDKAGILSLITFFYNFELFQKARRKDLDDGDLYDVPHWLASEKVGNDLEDQWTKEKKKSEKPSLLKTLTLVFGKRYIFLGFVQLVIKTALLFVQPYVLSKVVAYFTPDQTQISENHLYIYATVLLLLSAFTITYNHNYQQFLIEVSIRVRTSLAALIFRKTLKLSPNTLSQVTSGKIVTLITKDIFAFENALTFVNDMWIGIIQISIFTYIIYKRVGPSVFGGIGFYLLVIPVQLYVGKQISSRRVKSAKRTDERIQLATQTIKNIKTIKMYSWEKFFEDKIKVLRKFELKYLQPVYYLKMVVLIIGSVSTNLSFFILVMIYVWSGHFTNAETIYFIQSCYAALKSYFQASIPFGIAQCSDLSASVQRITDFLMSEEMVQRRNDAAAPKVYMDHVASKVQDTEVLKDISFSIEKGILLITGNLGSGKSSIIKTLLGEYHVTEGHMRIDGSISYASEEPWLFPSTVKQNILFGQEYDEKRYNEVLKVCALTVDLSRLEKGDQTIVGDRGINFSKGQQARINLARAVYRKSDIYLIDDILSGLDNKVNFYIFKKCLMEFLEDKIVIVVSNNINHFKLLYGKDVLVVENGRTMSLEKQKETLDKRITYYMDDVDTNYYDMENDFQDDVIPEEDDESKELLPKSDEGESKHLYYEKKKSGHVNIGVYLKYYKHSGGVLMLVALLIIFITAQAAMSLSDKVVSLWVNIEPEVIKLSMSNQTNSTKSEEVLQKRRHYLTMYAIFIVLMVVLYFIRTYLNFFFAIRASKNLHKKMTSSVLNAFMSFFDKHLVGNVINRFSKDVMTMDESIPIITYEIFRNTLAFLGILYLVISVNKFFIVPSIVLIIILFFIQRFYIPAGRGIKRLEAATRSPMIGYLNSALDGLSAVRAYEKQNLLISEFDRHQNHFTSASYSMVCTSRFYAYVLDMASMLFLTVVVLKFVIYKDTLAGGVGLAISQAMGLTGLLQFVIRQYTELENNMTGIERILEYTDAEKENTTMGEKFADWPSHGKIEYSNVSLTYTTTKTKVLKDISFVVQPKEKIGIVGRTGAGKSSIISTLFRLYDIEGKIFIDGVNTKILALEHLRSRIAIIPQDPILFSGTIRSNLDPTEMFADEELWDAIVKVNIKSLFLTLEEKITENGNNYSSGQRQLICLARALISKNKIIVMDEATSNMDPETCSLLQMTIRRNFSDCTVLMIAHRLSTVLHCDRVMVVDHGEILEFDTPDALKSDKNSTFYNMIKHSGLNE